MLKDRITYPEFEHFLAKYYKQNVELGHEISGLTSEEVKKIIISSVIKILNKEP